MIPDPQSYILDRAANIPLLYLVRQLMKNSAAQSLLRINGLLTVAPEGEFTDRFLPNHGFRKSC
jgi:hypothetical protein